MNCFGSPLFLCPEPSIRKADIGSAAAIMTPPILRREQSRRLDQRAQEEFGVSGLVLMENAGRGCVDCLCQLGINGLVVICCGRGNNAGDGFVMARHLDIRGHASRVLLWSETDQLAGDAAEKDDVACSDAWSSTVPPATPNLLPVIALSPRWLAAIGHVSRTRRSMISSTVFRRSLSRDIDAAEESETGS